MIQITNNPKFFSICKKYFHPSPSIPISSLLYRSRNVMDMNSNNLFSGALAKTRYLAKRLSVFLLPVIVAISITLANGCLSAGNYMGCVE